MKRIIKKLCQICVIVVLALALTCALGKLFSLPMFLVTDSTIKRDLDFYMLEMNYEPTDKKVAWDSELPRFIKKDIEYAEEHEYEIEYEFSGNKIRLYFWEEKWNLYVQKPYVYIPYDTMENISIYKTQDGNLAIYGYNSGWFQRIVLSGEDAEYDFLTYDVNIPLQEFNNGIGSLHVDGYSIVRDGEMFYFYKEGNKISSIEFPYGKCEKVDIFNGIILNSQKNLYEMYVYLKNGEPKLSFTHVGSVDSFKTKYYSTTSQIQYSEGARDIYLPILIKDNKYFTIVPEDWETFETYGVAIASSRSIRLAERVKDSNYVVNLVEMEKCFKEAEIHYKEDDQWYAKVKFTFNGKEFETSY